MPGASPRASGSGRPRTRAVAQVLEGEAQQRDLLGQRARLLLQPAGLPAEVDRHQEQHDRGDEEQQVGGDDDAQQVRGARQDPRCQTDDQDRHADAEPQHGVLLAQAVASHHLEEDDEDQSRADDAEHDGAAHEDTSRPGETAVGTPTSANGSASDAIRRSAAG